MPNGGWLVPLELHNSNVTVLVFWKGSNVAKIRIREIVIDADSRYRRYSYQAPETSGS